MVTIPYELKNGRRVASVRMIEVLEKLVKEYDILCAIHNHGPDMPELWPTAESIMKEIAKRDRRLGLCLDVVHESRAGADPVASIRRYGDRIYDIHINNARLPRDAQGRLAKDRKGRVPYLPVACPRGDIDLAAVCRALADVGFDGTIHLEHAISRRGDEREIAESIGYLRSRSARASPSSPSCSRSRCRATASCPSRRLRECSTSSRVCCRSRGATSRRRFSSASSP